MAQHTVFLVHGMGTFGKNWADNCIAQLGTLWESYPTLRDNFSLAHTAQFVPLTYDNVFEDWRTRLGKSNDAVVNHISGLQGGVPFDTLVDLTSKVTGKYFSATHLLDVALFYASPLFRSAVLTEIDAQIWAALPAVNQLQTFSVIAHSLGTAVMQQVLQARADLQRQNGLWPPKFRVVSLMMLANVSRILEAGGHGDVYESIVRPAKDAAQGVCDAYFNGRNRLDPIWWPKEFDPVGRWTWEADPKVQRFRHLSFTHLASENPHELADYLAHPLIHGNFFRSITSRKAISDSELQKRISDHEAQMPKTLIAIASHLGDLEFKNTLESLLELMVKVELLAGPQ